MRKLKNLCRLMQQIIDAEPTASSTDSSSEGAAKREKAQALINDIFDHIKTYDLRDDLACEGDASLGQAVRADEIVAAAQRNIGHAFDPPPER